MENWEKSVEEIVAETPATNKVNANFVYGKVLLPFLVILLSLHLVWSLQSKPVAASCVASTKVEVKKVDDLAKLTAENQKLKADLEKVAKRVVLLGAIVNENFAALPFEGRFVMLTHDWMLTHEPRHLNLCDPETAQLIKENVK
jgi:hypothetical protein